VTILSFILAVRSLIFNFMAFCPTSLLRIVETTLKAHRFKPCSLRLLSFPQYSGPYPFAGLLLISLFSKRC
jgi:hypothetical protein